MSKHTPGPWLLQASDKWRDAQGNVVKYGEYLISVGSRDQRDEAYYRIASVSNVNDSPANDANARLIAAAPLMLAELIEIFRWAKKEQIPLRPQEINSIERVILAATGSTHV